MSELKQIPLEYDGVSIMLSVIERDGETWILASPFAEHLGYAQGRRAVNNHVNPKNIRLARSLEFRIDGPSRGNPITPTTKFINMAGLFDLINGSKNVKGSKFRDWINHNVLPQLWQIGNDKKLDNIVENTGEMHGLLSGMTKVMGAVHGMAQLSAQRDEQIMRLICNSASTIVDMIQQSKKETNRTVKELVPHIVKRPENPLKNHVLRIYRVDGGSADKTHGGFTYKGIRRQKGSIQGLPNDSMHKLIIEMETPNAINAFNRLKNHLKDYKMIRSNVIRCNANEKEIKRLLQLK